MAGRSACRRTPDRRHVQVIAQEVGGIVRRANRGHGGVEIGLGGTQRRGEREVRLAALLLGHIVLARPVDGGLRIDQAALRLQKARAAPLIGDARRIGGTQRAHLGDASRAPALDGEQRFF
jgi:hypothetical protein